MFLKVYTEQIKNYIRIVLFCELFRKLQFLTPTLYEGLGGVYWLENNDYIFYWLEKKMLIREKWKIKENLKKKVKNSRKKIRKLNNEK